MDKLFLQIINMSITSSYVILFIIMVRLFMKRIPKVFSYALWGIGFLRLIVPISIESIYSLISINTRAIPEDIVFSKRPEIQSGIGILDTAVNRVLPAPTIEAASINPIQIWIFIATIIWIMGICLLMVYSIISTVRLSRKVKSAYLLYDNIYETKEIETPFVFGILNPKIYLPNNLSKTERQYIIKHEETHIKRKDHIVKFLAYLITAIHWFNPLVWVGFYLMGEDMELSCDEYVIKKMGYEIKKDYSNSLLSLAMGRRIVGGSPLAFGESNTRGRIKNVLNYRKPKFWVVIVAIIATIVLSIGLLSNQPKNDDLNTLGRLDEQGSSIEDVAWEYIDNQIQMYESSQAEGFKFIDKEIIKLEKLSSFDDILPTPVELWTLEYRLKPERPENMQLLGGLAIEDGWLIDYGITGNPYLTVTYEDGELIYLGNANTLEFDINTWASQEIAIRIMLENKGLLSGETYEGDHVILQFPLSTGETAQLLLSRPVIQGRTGIWAVERWMDGNGTIYHALPMLDDDIRIGDYYKGMQERSQEGDSNQLLDPIEVGYDYIINTMGQILVRKNDLVIIDPATIEDFLKTPESHYIGYITEMIDHKGYLHLDRVEFLTLEDEERARELGIDTNLDMPSGFYIYNPDSYPTTLDVSSDAEYLMLDINRLSDYISLTKEEFIKHNQLLSYSPLYHIYVNGGYVTKIQEQYIP